MCFRSTTTVLATINTVDFFYACDGHLKDNGFASTIAPPPEQKVSDQEIRKIKEEWEEKQRRKEKPKEAEKTETQGKPTVTSTPPPPAPIPVPVPEQTTAAKPVHDKYALHRDVWAMRLAEHRKRRQTAAAKEVAPRLPSAPQRKL